MWDWFVTIALVAGVTWFIYRLTVGKTSSRDTVTVSRQRSGRDLASGRPAATRHTALRRRNRQRDAPIAGDSTRPAFPAPLPPVQNQAVANPYDSASQAGNTNLSFSQAVTPRRLSFGGARGGTGYDPSNTAAGNMQRDSGRRSAFPAPPPSSSSGLGNNNPFEASNAFEESFGMPLNQSFGGPLDQSTGLESVPPSPAVSEIRRPSSAVKRLVIQDENTPSNASKRQRRRPMDDVAMTGDAQQGGDGAPAIPPSSPLRDAQAMVTESSNHGANNVNNNDNDDDGPSSSPMDTRPQVSTKRRRSVSLENDENEPGNPPSIRARRRKEGFTLPSDVRRRAPARGARQRPLVHSVLRQYRALYQATPLQPQKKRARVSNTPIKQKEPEKKDSEMDAQNTSKDMSIGDVSAADLTSTNSNIGRGRVSLATENTPSISNPKKNKFASAGDEERREAKVARILQKASEAAREDEARKGVALFGDASAGEVAPVPSKSVTFSNSTSSSDDAKKPAVPAATGFSFGGVASSSAATTAAASTATSASGGKWKCPACEADNEASAKTCGTCMINRPADKSASASAAPAAAGGASKPAFTFGASTAAAASSSATTSASAPAPAFSFGQSTAAATTSTVASSASTPAPYTFGAATGASTTAASSTGATPSTTSAFGLSAPASSSSAPAAPGVFTFGASSSAAPASSGSAFGTAASTPASSAPFAFGGTPAAASSAPAFGKGTSAGTAPAAPSAFTFGASSGSSASATVSSASAFGTSAPAPAAFTGFGASTSATPAKPAATAFTGFGSSSAAAGSTGAYQFGATPAASSTPGFGQTAASAPATGGFGSTGTSSGFGTSSTGFGTSSSGFGTTPSANAFGSSGASTGFGNSSVSVSFGSGAATGASTGFGSSTGASFGTGSATGFGSTGGSSGFGQSSSGFGGAPASGFGSNNSNPGFGSGGGASGFGASNAGFGSGNSGTGFGASNNTGFGTGGAAPASFAGFGAAPGGNAFGAGAGMGAAPGGPNPFAAQAAAPAPGGVRRKILRRRGAKR